MGRIIISENVSLDGVVEDPRGDEGLGRGDWHARIGARDLEAWHARLLAEMDAADAVLLGRGSYEFFARRYPSRTGPMADRMNGVPKYVVSAALDTLDAVAGVAPWRNATLLTGDAVDAIAALRQQIGGDIVVYASRGLVPTLLDHDLADELRLMTYPVVVGAGRRLFGETAAVRSLRLDGARTVGDDLVLLTYRPAREV